MHKFLLTLKKDLSEILPAVLYFLITFNLLHLISGMILGPYVQRYYSYLGVSLEAIVMGKIIFIANALPFISLFPRKPLIYNITWKFIIYSLLMFIFWNAELGLHLYFDDKQWDIIWQQLSAILSMPEFWATEILALYFLLIYVIFHELVKAVGRKEVFTLMFKRQI